MLWPVGAQQTPVSIGEVILVGGGPGEPDLITVAGLAAIRTADVVLADRLAPPEVLSEAPEEAEIIMVGKVPRGPGTSQDRINELLVEHALAGRRVVRLKGGDSFVFGRGGEEWEVCVKAGIPVRVIPGVTSATSAAALAGIPVTHRGVASGFVVVTGHLPPERGDVDWGALARTGLTLVILMGVANLPAITAELVRNGLAADTPAAVIADASLATMRVVRGSLGTIAEDSGGLGAPAVTVIGAVAQLPLGS